MLPRLSMHARDLSKMYRLTIIGSLHALMAFAIATTSNAAIVTASMAADTQARIRTATDSDVSSSLIDSFSSNASIDNSVTNSALAYSFDTNSGSLTASSLLTANKTVSARRGGDHLGSSSMSLTFQVDADTNCSMAGNWGFSGASFDLADSLTYTLRDDSATLITSSTTSNGGVGSAAFNESLTLPTGTYQLSFQSSLSETFNRQDFAQVGWTINRFQLSPVTAIPEPSGVFFFGLLSVVLISRRRR